MNKINASRNLLTANDNIMPLPLNTIKEIIKSGYDENIDKEYMQFLQTNIYKKLKPYVDKALAEEQYEGSPIYNGYIDKDTIGSIVDKAIYFAEQDIPELKDIISNIDTASEFTQTALLRAIVQSIILNDIFNELRPANQDSINYDNSDVTIPIEEDMTTESSYDEIMPSPIAL